MSDVYRAEEGTVFLWRNGSKTQKLQCSTHGEAVAICEALNSGKCQTVNEAKDR